MNMALVGKVVRTFVFAFLGIFLPALASVALNLSNTVDWSVAKTALVSAVFAACTAGIRAVVAYFPVLSVDNGIGMTKNSDQ